MHQGNYVDFDEDDLLPTLEQIDDIDNRLMNYYSEDCSITEKGTLNSMREVEASATLFYWTED